MIPASAHTLCWETSTASRVLLVDDNVSLLTLFAEVLSHEGYGVVAVSNGSQAEVRAAAEPEFDLLITDYNMPGMNGVELASRLTLRQPNLPVLLISGGRLDDLPTAIVGSRGWRFLPKPIGYARLTSAVYELLPTSSPRISEIQRANPPPPT
jgi:two-component system, cell cycle sensor histidine kinase and response regulator CckA